MHHNSMKYYYITYILGGILSLLLATLLMPINFGTNLYLITYSLIILLCIFLTKKTKKIPYYRWAGIILVLCAPFIAVVLTAFLTPIPK
jgi:hypothetical protein